MSEDLRCLTVKLPWAAAVSAGAKTVENRTARWAYRGPVAIHASAAWSKRGADSEVIRRWWWGADGHPPLEATDFSYHFRKVLAVVELVDVHPDAGCCRPWGESTYTDDDGKTRTTLWHWVLEDIRPLDPPLAAKGRLGLWTPDPDLRAEIERQLG